MLNKVVHGSASPNLCHILGQLLLQDLVNLPVEDGRLLLLDVIGGDVSSLAAVVHDAPPVLGVIEQQQPLALPQVQLMTPLG